MYQKKQARNQSVSLRVTSREKKEFEYLAHKNHTNVSNWAYTILNKHKNSYGKVENIDQLLNGIELTLEGLLFTHEELRKIKNIDNNFFEENAKLEILKIKLFLEIVKFKKLKKSIESLNN